MLEYAPMLHVSYAQNYAGIINILPRPSQKEQGDLSQQHKQDDVKVQPHNYVPT